MSSTDRDAKARIAREFFRKELAPLAKTKDWLDGGRGASPDDSWFVRREKTRWTKADFEAQSVETPDALAGALATMWTRSGDADLARLAPRFAALAREVYDVDDQAGEVTPFMYVMF